VANRISGSPTASRPAPEVGHPSTPNSGSPRSSARSMNTPSTSWPSEWRSYENRTRREEGTRLFGRVDLRLLQPARVVDVDRLPLGEDVERRLPGLAVAVTGLLRAAERQVHLGADRARVDVRDPGLEVADRAERPVHVAREDRRREPEAHAVGGPDRLVEVADADERGRRPEDLLLRDPHLRVDVAEDRRPVEEAVVEPVAGRDLAAGEEVRALPHADLRVRVDLLER